MMTTKAKPAHGSQMTEIIDISELDCIYLTYDEPQADDFYAKIRAIVPWIQRVHGVKGSDAAHKAAAAASNTERFILIDGDNLPESSFFNEQLRLTSVNEHCVFRWRARNYINGLTYGNGGISSWTKTYVENMRSHEATDGSDTTQVEFCFDTDYWAMHDCYSSTHPHGDQYHAWRAGFREGVKLCLDQGRRLTPAEFESTWRGNRHNLEIWCTVGNDVDYGDWAIMGARYGAWRVMFDNNWDYTEVRDFDKLKEIYENFQDSYIEDYTTALTNRLGLNIVPLSSEQSKWYKDHTPPHINVDIMLPERDFNKVIHDTARSLWR
jgi:hypothetical protein